MGSPIATRATLDGIATYIDRRIPWANVFFLQRYGLARDDERLEPPHIVGEDFTLANPDGRTFGQDLVARADAMAELA